MLHIEYINMKLSYLVGLLTFNTNTTKSCLHLPQWIIAHQHRSFVNDKAEIVSIYLSTSDGLVVHM